MLYRLYADGSELACSDSICYVKYGTFSVELILTLVESLRQNPRHLSKYRGTPSYVIICNSVKRQLLAM